jgi:hypothetical protein
VNNTQSIVTELSQPKQYQALMTTPSVQAPKRGGSRLNRSKTLNPNQLNQQTTTNINSNQSIILALEQQQQQHLQQPQTQTNKTVAQPMTPPVPKVKKVSRPKPLLLNQQQQQQQQPIAQNSPPIGLLNRPLVNVFVSPSSAAAPLSQPQLSPHLNQLNAHHTIDYHKYFANQSAVNDGFINATPTPTSTPASAVDIYSDPNRYLYQSQQQQQQTSCYTNTTGYSNNAYLAHGSHKMMANQTLSHYDTAYFPRLEI